MTPANSINELIEDLGASAEYLDGYANIVSERMYGGKRPSGIWNLERAARNERQAAESLQALVRENGELREALEPFAAMAWLENYVKQETRRDAIYESGSPGLRCKITVADYCKARIALEGVKEG